MTHDRFRDRRSDPFIRIDRRAYELIHAHLDAQALAVYVALAYHANRDDEAHPKAETIHQTAQVSESTVHRRLGELERIGLIAVAYAIGTRGQTSNLYSLLDPPESVPLDWRARPRPERKTERVRTELRGGRLFRVIVQQEPAEGEAGCHPDTPHGRAGCLPDTPGGVSQTPQFAQLQPQPGCHPDTRTREEQAVTQQAGPNLWIEEAQLSSRLLWELVVPELNARVNDEISLRRCHLIARDGLRLTLAAPTNYARRRVDIHFRAAIEQAMSRHLGGSGWELTVITDQQRSAP